MATEYDYIVVGGGAAGSIVAATVAAAGYSVLLLERGQPVAADAIDVWDPTRWMRLLDDPTYELGIWSTCQAGLDGQPRALLQSQGLGGCQIHNAMVYVRGGPPTYDHWANDLGCTGWDYATLRPYFEQIEGTLDLSSPSNPLSTSVLTAAHNLNFRPNKNYNYAATAYGAVPFQFTMTPQADGSFRRSTAYQSFIGQAPAPNLTVICGAYARRLLFDVEAVSVEYQLADSGPVQLAVAAREVVLCAGAINTPALLLRSGIGPAGELLNCQVPVVLDQPNVGAHFHDDLGFGLPALATIPPPVCPSGYLAAGIFACDTGEPPPDPPGFMDVNIEVQVSTSRLYGVHPPGLVVGASAMHLQSSGSVTLDPYDPFGKAPVVNPNWMSAPGDMARAVAALNLVEAVINEPSLVAAWGLHPPAPIKEPEAFIRSHGLSVQHYVSSCRMGADPASSVVDPQLRVHGLARVRVMDASAAPTTVTGNTAGVAMVIAARGAALMLGS